MKSQAERPVAKFGQKRRETISEFIVEVTSGELAQVGHGGVHPDRLVSQVFDHRRTV